MPRKGKKQAFLKTLGNAIDFGKHINQMRKTGINKNSIMRAADSGYHSGDGFMTLVKKRKGGVQTKGGKFVWIDDGRPPNRNQVRRMNLAVKGKGNYPRRGMSSMSAPINRPMGIGKSQALAYSLARRPNPNINSMNLAKTVVSHMENISSVQGNGGGIANPAIYNYSINPGQASLFQWGGPVMANWTRYKPLSIVIQLTSTCASTSTGSWCVAFDYSPNKDPSSVDDLQTMRTMHNSYGDIKDHLTLVYHVPRILTSRKLFNIRTGNVPQGQDINEYDLGHIYIGVESGVNDVIGFVSVSYSFALSEPNAKPASPGGYYDSTNSVAVTMRTLFTVGKEFSNNAVVNYTINSDPSNSAILLTFLVPFTGYVDWSTSFENGPGDFVDMTGGDTANWPWLMTAVNTSTKSILYNIQTYYDSQNYEAGTALFWVKAFAGDTFSISPLIAWGGAIYYSITSVLSDATVNPSLPTHSDPGSYAPTPLTTRIVRTSDYTNNTKLINRVLKPVVRIELSDETSEQKYPNDDENCDEENCKHGERASSTPPIIHVHQDDVVDDNLINKNKTSSTKKKVVTSTQMFIKKQAEQGPSFIFYFLTLVYFLASIILLDAQIIPPFSKSPTSPTTKYPTKTWTRIPTINPTVPVSHFGQYSTLRLFYANSSCIFGANDLLSTGNIFKAYNCTTLQFTHYGKWNGIITIEYHLSSAITALPPLAFGTTFKQNSVYGSCQRTNMVQQIVVYDIQHNQFMAYTNKNFIISSGVKQIFVYATPMGWNTEFITTYYPEGWNYANANTWQLPQCSGGTCNLTPAPTPAPVSLIQI